MNYDLWEISPEVQYELNDDGGGEEEGMLVCTLDVWQSDSGRHMCKQSAPDATLTEEACSRLPPHPHTFSQPIVSSLKLEQRPS